MMMASEFQKQLLTDKKALYSEYLNAERAILGSAQEYTMGSRRLRRADLPYIQAEKRKLEKEIPELEAVVSGKSRRKSLRVTPRDL